MRALTVRLTIHDPSWLEESWGHPPARDEHLEIGQGVRVVFGGSTRQRGAVPDIDPEIVRFVFENVLTPGAVAVASAWLFSLIERRPRPAVGVTINETIVNVVIREEVERIFIEQLEHREEPTPEV